MVKPTRETRPFLARRCRTSRVSQWRDRGNHLQSSPWLAVSIPPCFVSLPTVPEKNNVPFLDDVLLSFEPYLGLFLRRRNTTRRQQVLASHHFRTDEPLLDVAMDLTRGFDGRRTFANRPRPHFQLARGKKRNQPHQVIRGADQPVQSRLL